MDGFLSTSEQIDETKYFGDYLIVINVPPTSNTTNLFSCFAFLAQYAQFYAEKEVLFTPLNTFVIKSVYEKDGKKVIELDFVCFDNIDELELEEEVKENLMENFAYQMSMFLENNDQS